MTMEPAAQALRPLPGEDQTTLALPEVASWIAIYEELSSVLRLVLSRLNGDAQSTDFQRNLTFVEERLALWRDRHQALAGVSIDRKDHSLTFGGRYLKLTRREADLLDFLLTHPGRHFTTRQLTVLAWQNSRLSDAQVRTYMMRLRRRLHEVGLDGLITIVRNRGYGADLPKMAAD
ncbi:MAG TPA: winged helix-turn-helix domain-containing protein [Candidatus Dormibacteraeota bacterium]|jgi:DNA-binding response OmpR family regulator|nr:winged helix-turn-helix domain-containing protein [Candidatus Dormibacteraeota bacterium]